MKTVCQASMVVLFVFANITGLFTLGYCSGYRHAREQSIRRLSDAHGDNARLEVENSLLRQAADPVEAPSPWQEGPQPELLPGVVGAADPHDSKWSSLVRQLNKTPATCAACGGEGPINWHHIKPWHLCVGKLEALRYERANLIPLCADERRKCHWIFGHCGVSWSAYNPDVVEHAAEHLRTVEAARERLGAK